MTHLFRWVCTNPSLGIHVQKKKNINLNWNWNEDLLAPMRQHIDLAFRTVLDESYEMFKAQAAQAIKDVLNELDNTLKGQVNIVRWKQSTNTGQMMHKL